MSGVTTGNCVHAGWQGQWGLAAVLGCPVPCSCSVLLQRETYQVQATPWQGMCHIIIGQPGVLHHAASRAPRHPH
jgi:hypothetical protein